MEIGTYFFKGSFGVLLFTKMLAHRRTAVNCCCCGYNRFKNIKNHVVIKLCRRSKVNTLEKSPKSEILWVKKLNSMAYI